MKKVPTDKFFERLEITIVIIIILYFFFVIYSLTQI